MATNAFKEFVKEVKDNSFPDKEHSYSMSPSEISKFKQYLKRKIKSRNSNLLFRKIGLGDQNKLRGSYKLKDIVLSFTSG